jgi:hypothetical protein
MIAAIIVIICIFVALGVAFGNPQGLRNRYSGW